MVVGVLGVLAEALEGSVTRPERAAAATAVREAVLLRAVSRLHDDEVGGEHLRERELGQCRLRVGDRVWARHTKAGELSEHANEFYVVDGDSVSEVVPKYRGEGKAFL